MLGVSFLIFFLISISKGRKNILFIGSDDLRPNLGVFNYVNDDIFNSPVMVTPNLDKLASKSILFDHAYVQYAVCSPSRTSMLTSRRPDTTHITDLTSYFREIGGNFTTIPQFFKNNRYTSINVGKIFHHGVKSSGPGGDDDISWSEKFHAAENDIYNGNGNSWESVQKNEKPLRDTVEASWVIQRLQQLAPSALLGEENFFLGWGLHKPHLPFIFPEEFGDLYPLESVSLPRNPYAPFQMPDTAWSGWGGLRKYNDCTKEAIGDDHLGEVNVTLPDFKVLELRRAYYSAISYIDMEIGRVLDELELLGLAENTIIAFWGDHGWQLGEHSEWCKQTNFEVATRAPLMIHIPQLTDGGLRTKKLVEFVDIFPTLVEATEFPALEVCPEMSNETDLCTEGSSLLPLVNDPETVTWKDAVFWQYRRGEKVCQDCNHIMSIMGYSIRTDAYRFTEWVGISYLGGNNYEPNWHYKDHPELYDLINDPEENVNLYNDPAYSEVKSQLRKKLRAGWREAQPSV